MTSQILSLLALGISLLSVVVTIFNLGVSLGWFDRPLNRLWAWQEARKERKNS